jgi:serine/threonine-protein kinase
VTADATMGMQEVDRSRAYLAVAALLAGVCAASTFFLRGDPLARNAFLACIGVASLSKVWLGIVTRRAEGYTAARAVVAAQASALTAVAGNYFYGMFSPAAVIYPLGIYFFGAAQSFPAAFSAYLTCAVGEFVVGGLVLFGALDDRGIIRADGVPRAECVTVLCLVQCTMLTAFVVARFVRRATVAAIEKHDRALRAVARREALLDEARHELDRALRFGGIGRFTDTTLGPFRLGSVLGRGAMGEVYDATHEKTGTAAAVKLLQPHVLSDGEMVRRFLREAQIAASLDVPNVVKVLEVGGLDAALPYIAMERLEGEDLADYLRKHRRMTVARAVVLVRHVGTALAAAREAGIVHRDIKPRNVFFAENPATPGRGTWKVLDFGVSKLSSANVSLTGDALVGTPAFMAPEQASGKPVDYRADLYALGVIVYRALTGRPAFTGEQTTDTLFQVMFTMPPRPSEAAEVHPDVDLVLGLAMAKRREDRFDSGFELADALERASKGELDAATRRRAEAVLKKHPWGLAMEDGRAE